MKSQNGSFSRILEEVANWTEWKITVQFLLGMKGDQRWKNAEKKL